MSRLKAVATWPESDILGDLLREPDTARAVLRALMRDMRIQIRNGAALPSWAQPVLSELAVVAEVERSAIGTPVATVVLGDSRMVPVADAADAVGLSEGYVRRLVRTHRVRGRRVGARTWLIDLDSLEGVTAHGRQDRAS